MPADPIDLPQNSASQPHARQAEARRATAAVDAVTGRRWCPTCVSYRPLEGGAFTAGRIKRFKCAACRARTRRQMELIAARRTILDT